jgi:hypothetical protein
MKFSKTRRTKCFVPLLILRKHSTKFGEMVFGTIEIVCNPFKLQFVKYDSRSFMNTAKRKGDK